MSNEKIIQAVKDILIELYPNWEQDQDFIDTPRRVTAALEHFFRNEEINGHIKIFPTKNDQVIIVKEIKCYSFCPHHLLPVLYEVAIGYIPEGKALGLSKLVRIARAIASFPMLQENFTQRIADFIQE